MAVVYAGFDPDIQREVAIKCLHREVAAEAGGRRRFLAEARAAGQLNHPHIVTVFDAGETADGRAYIAMERLSGETLASRVASDGFPPLPALIELVSQVASALDYAQARGVSHYDIKPDNIMLVDGWRHAKVADFGIAESRGAAPGGMLDAEIGGTPSYMAPERLCGETADPRSDLFSLGVVLFWLLSGKLPWPQTDDLTALMAARRRSPTPSLQLLDPATPLLLTGIVHTLLDPSAKARYQRGAELIEDLQLAQREGERLRAQPLNARMVSLRLRLAGTLGVVLFFCLLFGLAAIHAKQNAAITGLALDFGSSLARVVASESAENLLLGDRPATRALVENIARNQQIDYLAIADRSGEIVASTRRAEIGSALSTPGGQLLLREASDVASYRSAADTAGRAGSSDMLLFDVPVRYQSATVGKLQLGVSNAPLRAAQRTTLWVIAAVLLLTLVAVLGAAYWLTRHLLAMLDVITTALLRVAGGDSRYRIRLLRGDELGKLFAAFNVMASTLDGLRHGANRSADSTVPGDDVAQPTRIMSKPLPHAGPAASSPSPSPE